MRRASEQVSRSSPEGPGAQVPDLASFLEEVTQTPVPPFKRAREGAGVVQNHEQVTPFHKSWRS